MHAIPEKAEYEITFSRLEGYRQSIRNRVSVDWPAIARVRLDPTHIPPEVQVKGLLPSNSGRPTLSGPGALVDVSLNPFRAGRRMQELVFQMARDLTRHYAERPDGAGSEVPIHVLFPQVARIVERYLREKVVPEPPAERIDVFLSPYYGLVIERLVEAIKPDTAQGEAPELPVLEKNRGAGSTAEVDFWTSREVREVQKCHLNYVVADTQQWEQSAAYLIDTHPAVAAFVKNAQLGFAIPYLHHGQPHDYEPDFIIKLKREPQRHLILKIKGYDPVAEIEEQAANRWVAAMNAEGRCGTWSYLIARKVADVPNILSTVT